MKKKSARKQSGREGREEEVNPNRPVPGYFYDSPISYYLSAVFWLGINTDMGNT